MKKYFALFIGLAILMTACDPKETDEYKSLKAKSDSLEGMAKLKDNSISDFIVSFNKIQRNLNSIKDKEKIITVNSKANPENKEEMAQKINEDIQSIYDLMTQNKLQIAKLKKQLKKANAKVSELEKMIAYLNQQIAEKDEQIKQLKSQVENMNIKITAMEAKIDTMKALSEMQDKKINEQSQEIDAKTSELNTAYYAFGKEKELVKNNVLEKGALGGLGKAQKLASNFNKDYFTKIDLTEVKGIALFAKKARLVSNHPNSSYKFVGANKADSLVITNPKDFWGATKYCVIVVD